jgi:hypothetical protein
MGDERASRDSDLSRRQVNAADLIKVKEAYKALVRELQNSLSIGEFATIMRKAKELAGEVGGIEALTACAEALEELQR